MNVYDKINELATALKESSEFKEYVIIKEEVYKDEENKKIVKDFREKQMEIQKLAMDGNEKDAIAKNEILKQMYEIILKNENIKKLFDAEVRFDVLIGDMYRILGESIKGAMED